MLAFPSGDFKNQELDSLKKIKDFCRLSKKATFPLFAKISVKEGKEQHPIYDWITNKKKHSKAGEPAWNFHKYLFDAEGQFLESFKPPEDPKGQKIVRFIERSLKKRGPYVAPKKGVELQGTKEKPTKPGVPK